MLSVEDEREAGGVVRRAWVYVLSECTSSAKMGVGCALACRLRRRGWVACVLLMGVGWASIAGLSVCVCVLARWARVVMSWDALRAFSREF